MSTIENLTRFKALRIEANALYKESLSLEYQFDLFFYRLVNESTSLSTSEHRALFEDAMLCHKTVLGILAEIRVLNQEAHAVRKSK
jgi:hypothetical protein